MSSKTKAELEKELKNLKPQLKGTPATQAQKIADAAMKPNPKYIFRSKYETSIGIKIGKEGHTCMFHNCTFVADEIKAAAWNTTREEIKKALMKVGSYRTVFLLVGGTGVEVTEEMAAFNVRADKVMKSKSHQVKTGMRSSGA